MQPTGWNQQPGPGAPPAWSAPPGPAAPAAPAGPGRLEPGWGDHAPGFGNPPPTWGATAEPGRSALDDGDEPRGIGWTIAAHVVLWGGLALALLSGPTLLAPLQRASLPYWAVYTASNLLVTVPVWVALVLAGRSVVLRLTGLFGGAVVTAVVLSYGFRIGSDPRDFPSYPWVLSIVTFVLGLGTWMIVRRHARWGLALLVVFAGLMLLWTGPAGPQLSVFMLQHVGYHRLLYASWNLVPVVVAGVFGLVSSFLRPRPGRSTDGVGLAVVGGLVLLTVFAFALTFVG